MEQQLFTDGVGRITVIGGVVRLDLVTYSPNETDAQGRPRQVFTQRLVMGTDAFLRSSEKILEIVQHLTKAQGAQQAQPQQPARPAPQPVPQPVAQPAPPQPVAPQAAPPRKDAPPYTTGPLFPDPTPPKAPFP
jgi:hypothetical protein